MEDLIDQSHRIDLAALHSLFRIRGQVALGIDLLNEFSGSVEIGKDYIAIIGK